MKQDQLLIPHIRINSKCIKDLNIKSETIKIIEENIGSKISETAHSYSLSDVSPLARETKEKKQQQMGLHQTKKICTAKKPSTK